MNAKRTPFEAPPSAAPGVISRGRACCTLLSRRFAGRQGFSTLSMVSTIAILISISLQSVFRSGLMHRDQSAKAQVRMDYSQREEALLRAVVTVFPQKVIDCMKSNHADAPQHSWQAIFAEAVTMASAGEMLTEEERTALSLGGARLGNVADRGNARVQSWITSLEGVAGEVTPGTTSFAGVFDGAGLVQRVPPLLDMEASLQAVDALCPVVTPEKRHASQAPGLLADVGRYPGCNLIPYPDIRFGYAAPGQSFVARRNWWAFAVNFGAESMNGSTPVPVVTKRYVLSLYEIPSQMPIEAATLAEVGRHQDGTAWNAGAIQIDGSVYASRLRMDGAFGASGVVGRSGIDILSPLRVADATFAADFDALGVREQFQAQRNSHSLPVALSANSGRLAFLALGRGGRFLHASATPSVWDRYTRGAEQCQVRVAAVEMASLSNQTPVAIRVVFQAEGGGATQVNLRRGDNWPSDLEPGGELMPFQTELTLTSQASLIFYPERLNDWLAAIGGAPVAVNHSLNFVTDSSADPDTVRPLPGEDETPAADDMAVVIRKGKNLTAYTAGLSIVTPFRVYVGDDLNATPLPGPPAGSGLDAGAEYFPPLSLFAGELRIGTTTFVRPFDHTGQLGSLRTAEGGAWQPLDVKSGADDQVHAEEITARLSRLRSPADLPPVHQMNWLVTIEELPRG